MMRKMMLVFAAAAAGLLAQDIQFPASFDELAKKADEVVNVTLDASMLGFASQFLSEEKEDEQAAKKLVEGLKGIYVRSYKFSEENQYSMADVEAIRSQLREPEWSPMVTVQSNKPGGDNAWIYVRKTNGKFSGLTVIAPEPKELTVVHINGLISPDDLKKLGGNFGVPRIHMGPAEETEN